MADGLDERGGDRGGAPQQAAEARSRAEDIDPEEIPSRERRGRLGVEIARAYHQRRDYPAMLHWLEQAYQTSADSGRS